MRFDLTDLRLFLAVVHRGSITGGAGTMNLALASASQRISAMEASLGIPLLQRVSRGVLPTQAGIALLRHAEEIVARSDRMWGEMRGFSTGERGRVHLLSNTGALLGVLPRLLRTFLLSNPGIDLDVEERPSSEIVRLVTERVAELGVIADVVDPGVLTVRTLAEDHLVMVAAAAHRFAGNTQIAFADVVQEPLVGLLDAALEQHLTEHAARHGVRPRHRIRLRSIHAIGRMVEAGVGIAILPANTLAGLSGMAIATVPLIDPWARRRLALCSRTPEHLTYHARLLLEHMSDTHAPND